MKSPDSPLPLIKIIHQRVLFLTASVYFLNKKNAAKQLIRVQELVDLIDTQRGSIKQQEKKIQDYAHFDKPFRIKK